MTQVVVFSGAVESVCEVPNRYELYLGDRREEAGWREEEEDVGLTRECDRQAGAQN